MKFFPRKGTQKGFTLIELVIAIGVFVIVMSGVLQIFGTGFMAYGEARRLQTNLEEAQFSMNTIAKELRTSSVIPTLTENSGGYFSVTFIDYSQNKCIRYVANSGGNGKLMKYSRAVIGTTPEDKRDDCETGVTAYVGDLISRGITSAKLDVIPSLPGVAGAAGRVGRLTVSLTFSESSKPAIIQTSVSLRDFNYVGI
jgi:prepilin-type N-terminal cleavage/methylation domain-containing protein